MSEYSGSHAYLGGSVIDPFSPAEIAAFEAKQKARRAAENMPLTINSPPAMLHCDDCRYWIVDKVSPGTTPAQQREIDHHPRLRAHGSCHHRSPRPGHATLWAPTEASDSCGDFAPITP